MVAQRYAQRYDTTVRRDRPTTLPSPRRSHATAAPARVGAFRGIVFGFLPSLGLWATIILLVRRLLGG